MYCIYAGRRRRYLSRACSVTPVHGTGIRHLPHGRYISRSRIWRPPFSVKGKQMHGCNARRRRYKQSMQGHSSLSCLHRLLPSHFDVMDANQQYYTVNWFLQVHYISSIDIANSVTTISTNNPISLRIRVRDCHQRRWKLNVCHVDYFVPKLQSILLKCSFILYHCSHVECILRELWG